MVILFVFYDLVLWWTGRSLTVPFERSWPDDNSYYWERQNHKFWFVGTKKRNVSASVMQETLELVLTETISFPGSNFADELNRDFKKASIILEGKFSQLSIIPPLKAFEETFFHGNTVLNLLQHTFIIIMIYMFLFFHWLSVTPHHTINRLMGSFLVDLCILRLHCA